FCGTSEVGKKAVGRIEPIASDDAIKYCFTLSKSKIVPRKVATIQKLELTMAISIASSMRLSMDKLMLHLGCRVPWTGSTAALQYICHTSSRFAIFVVNPVRPSHKYTTTSLKACDLGSRFGRCNVDGSFALTFT
ncbi:uncharacterized protein DEA37_0009584, partial [Paragonimus westermani]